MNDVVEQLGTTRAGAAAMPAGVLLVLEASTAHGSAAIVHGTQILGHADVAMGASRDDHLFPAVQSLLGTCGFSPAALAGVVCGQGPGSFTSLRIAGSLCKGLAHGAGIALYTVPSMLLALAHFARTTGVSSVGEWLVHGDALRGERYAMHAHVDNAMSVVSVGATTRVPMAELSAHARGARRIAIGASTEPENEHVVVWPDARGVIGLRDWSACGPVSLADWEPSYGRLAEAQVVWEQKHGHALPAA